MDSFYAYIHPECAVSKRDRFLNVLTLLLCLTCIIWASKLIYKYVFANHVEIVAMWMLNYAA